MKNIEFKKKACVIFCGRLYGRLNKYDMKKYLSFYDLNKDINMDDIVNIRLLQDDRVEIIVLRDNKNEVEMFLSHYINDINCINVEMIIMYSNNKISKGYCII